MDVHEWANITSVSSLPGPVAMYWCSSGADLAIVEPKGQIQQGQRVLLENSSLLKWITNKVEYDGGEEV